MKKLLSTLFWVAIAPLSAQSIFISEFHYDDPQTDTKEFVEITGLAGNALDCYQLFYVNSGVSPATIYRTINFKDSSIILQKSGHGTLLISNAKSDQIQNGPKDGFLLYDSCHAKVVQFISYEGTIEGLPPYTHQPSQDIAVSETAEPDSIALHASGKAPAHTLVWKKGQKTPDQLNPDLLFDQASVGSLSGNIFSNALNCVNYQGPKFSVTLIHYGIDKLLGTEDDNFFSVPITSQGRYTINNIPSGGYYLKVNLPKEYHVVDGDNPVKLLVGGTNTYYSFCVDGLATQINDEIAEDDISLVQSGKLLQIQAGDEISQVNLCNVLGQEETHKAAEFQTQLSGIVFVRVYTSKGTYLKRIILE